MRIAPTLVSVSLLFVGLAGCKNDPAPDGDRPTVSNPVPGRPAGSMTTPASDRVLAEIDDVKITESQVLPVLYESYGLDVLLKVVQLDLAKYATAQAKVTVAKADVDAERQLTLAAAFPDQKPEDYETLLGQFLGQQRVSRAEFAVVIETNAHLRALVRKQAEADISEETIRAEYNILYGERVRVKHIALNNLQEVVEARRRLEGVPVKVGDPAPPPEPFEQVARAMSVNRISGAQGGELPPFARTSPGYSEVFIQAAFALKPGEVSTDAVQEGRYYHLLKAVERIPPQVVKFDDVRDSVRAELVRRRQGNLMNARRGEMAQAAIKQLQINDSVLKKQFDDRLAAANPKPAEKDEVRRDLDEQRIRLNQPATAATTEPSAPATTAPTTRGG